MTIPIQDVVHRIQWDPDFGDADIVIGYFDRLKRAKCECPSGTSASRRASTSPS